MGVKISLCQKIAKWQPKADCLQDMNSKKNIYSNVLCPQIKSIFIQFFSWQVHILPRGGNKGKGTAQLHEFYMWATNQLQQPCPTI